MHYFGARYYTADFPRFVSPDPVSGRLMTPITWNRYLYCRNDPINYIDPDGEWAFGILIFDTAIKTHRTIRNDRLSKQRLNDLKNDSGTIKLDIYTTNEAFDSPRGHHLYVTDPAPGTNFRSIGRHGSMGKGSGPEGNRGAPEAPEAGHTKVGEMLLPEGTCLEEFNDFLENNINSGIYRLFINDCHNVLFNAAVDFDGAYQMNESYEGRFRSSRTAEEQ
jgi:hypothetical protein